MLPETWLNVKSLLVAFSSLAPGDRSQLLPAIRLLQQNLPTAEISWLNHDADGFRVGAIDSLETPGQRYRFNNCDHNDNLITWLKRHQFDAAIIFTTPAQSPYALAYICYLADIPMRCGQSQEFGGGVLSSPIKANPQTALAEYHLDLLAALGFSALKTVHR